MGRSLLRNGIALATASPPQHPDQLIHLIEQGLQLAGVIIRIGGLGNKIQAVGVGAGAGDDVVEAAVGDFASLEPKQLSSVNPSK